MTSEALTTPAHKTGRTALTALAKIAHYSPASTVQPVAIAREALVKMIGGWDRDTCDDAIKHADVAPDLVKALENVQRIIAEAAMTGFNWQDGDWADRLFASQRVTSAALSATRSTGDQS